MRNPALAFALLASGLLVAACGDSSTESESGALQVLRGEVSAPLIDAVDGVTRVRCDLPFMARARRDIIWTGARARFYPAHERTPFDSITFTGDEIRDAFGGDLLESDDVVLSNWYFYAEVPFTLDIDFLYQANGSPGVAEPVSFYCGPEVPDNAEPLEIISLTSQEGDSITPNDILNLHAELTAPAGTWQEIYEMSGGCDSVYYGSVPLESGFDRDLYLTLPSVCNAGQGIEIRMIAIDAALNFDERNLSTGAIVQGGASGAVQRLNALRGRGYSLRVGGGVSGKR